jgi:hypothetical protein
MAAAAIPLLLKTGATIGGSLLAKKMAGPTSQQSAAMTGTQGAAGTLGQAAPQLIGAGQQLTQQGAGYAGNAANYYQKLLGTRSSLREATAPDTAAALDYYGGAANKIGRTMRGGARDTALAELDREKVGKLALLPAMARGEAGKNLTGAAAPLLNAGASQTGQGIYGASAGAGANSSLYNQASDQADQQRRSGAGFGRFIYDAINSAWGKGTKSKSGFGGIPAFDSRMGIPSF